jgi:hypothetical protein
MSRVHRNDVLSQAQNALTELVAGHDGAQVAHGLAVLVGIGYGSQRVQPALILGQRLDVCPRGIVVVEPGHIALL